MTGGWRAVMMLIEGFSRCGDVVQMVDINEDERFISILWNI